MQLYIVTSHKCDIMDISVQFFERTVCWKAWVFEKKLISGKITKVNPFEKIPLFTLF